MLRVHEAYVSQGKGKATAGDPNTLARRHVGQLLRLTGVDSDRKFINQWVLIKFKLGGRAPTIFPVALQNALAGVFRTFTAQFSDSRHTLLCDKNTTKKRHPSCHTRFGCRHSLPYYPLLVKHLILVASALYQEDSWRQLSNEFSLLKTAPKLVWLDMLIARVFGALGWPFVSCIPSMPTDMTKKVRAKFENVYGYVEWSSC